jgi:hypothetical protein
MKFELISQCLLEIRLNQDFFYDFACAYSYILFLFILNNSLVLANDKHIHNMMQPPPCLKIRKVVLSDVLYLPQT